MLFFTLNRRSQLVVRSFVQQPQSGEPTELLSNCRQAGPAIGATHHHAGPATYAALRSI
jgi:hypothetical protein